MAGEGGGAKGKNVLWSGFHAITGDAVRLIVKADRCPLLILKKGKGSNGQVCQLRTTWLTEIEEDKRMAAALDIMKEVAEAFTKGKAEEDALFKVRDGILKERGVVTTRPDGAPAAVVGKAKKQ